MKYLAKLIFFQLAKDGNYFLKVYRISEMMIAYSQVMITQLGALALAARHRT